MRFLRHSTVPPLPDPSLQIFEVKNDPLFREMVPSISMRSAGVEELIGEAVQYLGARSRAAAVAMGVVNGRMERWWYRGEFEERLKSAISRSRGTEPSAGEFAAFGFPDAVCEQSRGSGRVRAWLGFVSQAPVTVFDARLAAGVVRLVEEEIRYREQLGQLSGNIDRGSSLAQFSHDIRSPLNNIKAILALLKLEELRSESAELLDVALANCRGVESIVEDVIDLSRLRAGKLVARPARFDLGELVREVSEGFAVSARLKGLRLEADGPGRIMTTTDRNQIRRVLSNLICNALKYTNEGTVSVRIEGSESGLVSVSVRDTGVGMSCSEISRLFVPFSRVGREDCPGLGLGLSIAKELVEANGGTLRVSSAPGKGSLFVMSIPGALCSHGTGGREDSRRQTSGRILLIDAHQEHQREIANVLQRDGFLVDTARSVREGGEILNFGGADLVMCRAAEAGIGVLEELGRFKTPIPVILLSEFPEVDRALRDRCAAVLIEPCDYTMLPSTIREVLDPRLCAVGG